MVFCRDQIVYLQVGFGKTPAVVFIHDPIRKLATASTCDLHLRLPVGHGSDYESLGRYGFVYQRQ